MKTYCHNRYLKLGPKFKYSKISKNALALIQNVYFIIKMNLVYI